jgi:hypothetical protein
MTNPATWEAEAEGAQVPGPSGPSSEALTQKIKKERKKRPSMAFHACNPNCLVGRDQKDLSLKPVQAKS